MKKLASLAIFTLFASTLAFAETSCFTETEAAINAFSIKPGFSEILTGNPTDLYDKTEKFTKLGSELSTTTGSVEVGGTDLIFKGRPTVGALVQGAYPSWEGSQVDVWTSIEFSTNWKPDGREVCTQHKTVFAHGRKCVKKEMEYSPTSFVVDLTTGAGTHMHYAKVFTNVNQANHYTINMPRLRCDGPVNNFEVRVRDLIGGDVEFRVHKVTYSAGWKY